MEKLVMTPDLASLPVTDLSHVIREINTDRKVQEAIRYERQHRAKYQQEWYERRKNL